MSSSLQQEAATCLHDSNADDDVEVGSTVPEKL